MAIFGVWVLMKNGGRLALMKCFSGRFWGILPNHTRWSKFFGVYSPTIQGDQSYNFVFKKNSHYLFTSPRLKNQTWILKLWRQAISLEANQWANSPIAQVTCENQRISIGARSCEVWLIRDSAFNREGASTLTKLEPTSVGAPWGNWLKLGQNWRRMAR